jgi:uncharacterized protein (DUF427 family)
MRPFNNIRIAANANQPIFSGVPSVQNTDSSNIDPYATQMIEPLTQNQLDNYLPPTILIVRDANNGSIIAEADIDQHVIIDEGSYYIDPTKVNPHRLEKTDRSVTCPYKGSGYWLDLVDDHARVRDAAWVYTDTNPDYERFRNRIGFYSRNFRGTIVEVITTDTRIE